MSLNAWFGIDSVSVIFFSVTFLLFFGAAVYSVKYLKGVKKSIFVLCFTLFLLSMTGVILSRHMGLLWVMVEATTLVTAPLIYFHRTKSSLEATWKYLLICSVGIALALLGVFFLAVANVNNSNSLFFDDIIKNAGKLDIPWLKAAFLLIFVGYGTKMGLAPFHTWLPDAHSEAPSAVSALLSGALLNSAFLAIIRVYQICVAAGIGAWCREIFIIFGVISVFFAAFFILGQTDYKRMLAYSSVEYMGILSLGLGIGGKAIYGALIALIGHSLTKAALFFTAGNILSYCGTKNISDVRGLISGKTRVTGILWITGFLLITGIPPSGIFWGKFIILKEALSKGYNFVTIIFLAALAVVFVGMCKIFISMVYGAPNKNTADKKENRMFFACFPPALFFILVIIMGLYFPDWFTRALDAASRDLGGF